MKQKFKKVEIQKDQFWFYVSGVFFNQPGYFQLDDFEIYGYFAEDEEKLTESTVKEIYSRYFPTCLDLYNEIEKKLE